METGLIMSITETGENLDPRRNIPGIGQTVLSLSLSLSLCAVYIYIYEAGDTVQAMRRLVCLNHDTYRSISVCVYERAQIHNRKNPVAAGKMNTRHSKKTDC